MQYTIRNIPKDVDQALRKQAKAEGKSLNEAAIKALPEGVAADLSPQRAQVPQPEQHRRNDDRGGYEGDRGGERVDEEAWQ